MQLWYPNKVNMLRVLSMNISKQKLQVLEKYYPVLPCSIRDCITADFPATLGSQFHNLRRISPRVKPARPESKMYLAGAPGFGNPWVRFSQFKPKKSKTPDKTIDQIIPRHWVRFKFLFPLNLTWPFLLIYRSVVETSPSNWALFIDPLSNCLIRAELLKTIVLFGVGCLKARIQKVW